MRGIIIRWLILTIAMITTSYLIEGIRLESFFAALFAAAVLGILNAFFRPVILLLTLPINILSLGLFTFVINAVILLMASGVINGFKIDGFFSALLGSLLISIVSWILNTFINEEGNVKYIDLKYNKNKNTWE